MPSERAAQRAIKMLTMTLRLREEDRGEARRRGGHGESSSRGQRARIDIESH